MIIGCTLRKRWCLRRDLYSDEYRRHGGPAFQVDASQQCTPETVANSRTRRSKLDEFRSGTSSVLPVLFLIRLLFRCLLLRLHGPGWDDAIHPRVCHQLPKVLVRIRDQNVNHVSRIRLRTQLRQ